MASPEPIVDIDPETGELISGWTRIRWSIRTILTTRLRTRLMRLWWGSEFLNLQDKPAGMESFARSLVAAAEAVNLYEPEFRVNKIVIDELGADGHTLITMYGTDLTDQTARRLEVTF